MATVVKTTFQLKRGTAAKWVELNLVLAAGEPGFEIDSNRLKIGDGKTAWVDLPYIGEGSVVNAATHYDFPETGAAGIIYKAETEKLLYQWNEDLKAYEALGGGAGGSIIIDIELSESSTNAIANKTVALALKELESKINGDSYSFGDGLIVEEIDGIQTVRVDYDAIANLIPEIDLSNLATIEALKAVENKIPTKVSDLENDAGYLTEHQDLSDYALKSDIPSLEGLATETYVQQKIAEAELGDSEVDLSAYYTKEEVDSKINTIETTLENNYITIENGVTKEVLTETVEKEVQSVVIADLDALVEEKVSEAVTEGVSVNQINYGTF